MLSLAAGDLRLELAPSVGGAVAGFSHAGFALMRETPPGIADVHRFSSFPLVPFSNRIADGRFSFAGRTYQLRPNSPEGRHAIHGEGWRQPWSVAEADRCSARLILDYRPAEAGSWPFPFRAEQHFMLAGNELTATLVISNTGAVSAPAGFGLHPYFLRHDGVTLGFRAETVWRNGDDQLPSERESLPERWDFGAPRPLGAPGLDNCFAGWPGTAEIAWPAARRGLRIAADRCFGHAVVYTPAERDYFAFEPVSHMNDAINRMLTTPDHGLVVLAPGESLNGSVRFTISAISGA